MNKSLKSVELKTFIPSQFFDFSREFYTAIGFKEASNKNGIAYFSQGDCSFLLQDFYLEEFAKNMVMHFLVEDVEAWYIQISCLLEKFPFLQLSGVESQSWGMKDFTFKDPCGVLWRVAQNLQAP